MEWNAYFSKLPFAPYASKEEMRLAAQYAYTVSFTQGEVVHTRNQAECLGLALVTAGSLCASMISDEGKQILLYRLEVGESCVFTSRCVLNLLNYDTMVEAETAGTMLIIPETVLQRLMQNIRIENAMDRLALDRCARIMGTLERMLFARVDRRLAACLLQEAEKNDRLEVRRTHEQLARDISSAREVVSRTLARFAQEGLISLRRGTICIEQPQRLREMT